MHHQQINLYILGTPFSLPYYHHPASQRQEGLLLISQTKMSLSLIPGSLLIYVGLLKQNLRVWVYLSSGVCISLGNLGYIALNREKQNVS